MVSPANDCIQLIDDFHLCHTDVKLMIQSPGAAFFSRIGGSDTDIILQYFELESTKGSDDALCLIKSKFWMVKRFNGYYDKANDPSNMEKFCRLFIGSYRSCGQLFICGRRLLSEFLPSTLNQEFFVDTSDERAVFRAFFRTIGAEQQPARFYPYAYVERVLRGPFTFFRALAETLPGRRVLVISPFEESIRANFSRRQDFFPNYVYPEFELLTYNTPITYEGLPEKFYPDDDWFATLERMKREISSLDFEIALLACGSYAVPLGLYIRDEMKRKAIYVGGCLQLYFGVTGRRYENEGFSEQINRSAFILPLERDRFFRELQIAPQAALEAFGAYF